jgi:hypothetical protein
MPTTTWSMIERGARRINADRLPEIAAILDIEPDGLEAAWQRTRDQRIRHAEPTR